MNKNKVYFLCSPNMGIIDSWMPVIYKLNEIKEIDLIIIIPSPAIVRNIDLSNVLIKIATEVFSKIIFKGYDNRWHSSENFESTKYFLENQVFYKVFYKITNRIFKRQFCFTNTLKPLVSVDINGESKTLLYDIYEESKKYWKEIGDTFSYSKKFSLPYSNWIAGVDPKSKINSYLDGLIEIKNNQPEIIFAYSNKQEKYYKSLSSESRIITVGIPRHDQWWIDILSKYSINCEATFEEGYILVISRGGDSDRFSANDKEKSIEDIRRIAKKFKKKIVIKKHPKEITSKECLWECALGIDNYRKTWVYSNRHILPLASQSCFVVAFLSSVAPDIVRMKKPMVARYDLRGNSVYDNENSLRNNKGYPVMGYAQFNLEFLAIDFLELSEFYHESTKGDSTVLRRQCSAYRGLFSRENTSSEIVVKNILNCIG